MPVPDSVLRAADGFAARFRDIESTANDEFVTILDGFEAGTLSESAASRRVKALAADIDHQTDRLVSDARRFLVAQLSGAWRLGAEATNVGQFAWTGAHQSALALLVNDTASDVLANTTHMSDDVRQLVRSLPRFATLEKVGTGTPAKTQGRVLTERLRETGITSVVYADGRHIRASTYAEMAIRTRTAMAYNYGGLNQMVSHGIRYVEVADGAECGLVTHDDPDKPNGRILPADVAAAYPTSHPNCRRDLIPRADVTSDDEAMVATSWRSPEQLADQANFEKYLQAKAAGRQARQARTATRTPRTARTARGVA